MYLLRLYRVGKSVDTSKIPDDLILNSKHKHYIRSWMGQLLQIKIHCKM